MLFTFFNNRIVTETPWQYTGVEYVYTTQRAGWKRTGMRDATEKLKTSSCKGQTEPQFNSNTVLLLTHQDCGRKSFTSPFTSGFTSCVVKPRRGAVKSSSQTSPTNTGLLSLIKIIITARQIIVTKQMVAITHKTTNNAQQMDGRRAKGEE